MTKRLPVLLKNLPLEWRTGLLKERREARQAAAAFVRVCKDGDADQLYNASLYLNECAGDAWRLAMAGIAKLSQVSPEIREAFVPIWVESKFLPLRGRRPSDTG